MKTIPAVPESITRADYLKLIESVGFDVKDIEALEFRTDGIYAQVHERVGEHGIRIDKTTGRAIINRVFIPVKD